MKKIYLCHDFNGIYDNVKIISDRINSLITYNKFASYISPVHLFGILYDKVEPELYFNYCTSLLKDCDIMIIFGENSKTDECIHQISYCKNLGIPIIEYVDYCKNYMKSTI
jgi:hypothetical protein